MADARVAALIAALIAVLGGALMVTGVALVSIPGAVFTAGVLLAFAGYTSLGGGE